MQSPHQSSLMTSSWRAAPRRAALSMDSASIDARRLIASHSSALFFGRASTSENVHPVENRSWMARALSSTQHVHVPDVILEVWLAHALEAESLVEPLEVHLRRDANLFPSRVLDSANGFAHEFLSGASAAIARMRCDAPDRRFRIFCARREDSRVGYESLLLPAEQVQRLRVRAIGVEVGARLFHDEDALPELQCGVQLGCCELFEARKLPGENRLGHRRNI